jgi:YHS domain-containing protein
MWRRKKPVAAAHPTEKIDSPLGVAQWETSECKTDETAKEYTRMNRWIIGTLCVAGMAWSAAPILAQHGGEKSLPNCPVMGEPINLAVSTPTDDGPVFFCCKGCIAKYNAEPGKFAKKVAQQRKALEKLAKVQVRCPVTGEPADPKVAIETDGKKVSFCCKGCVEKYQADPKKYATKLANSYTHQTTCPVMGEEIDPKVFTTSANGERVYLCCKGCEKKLKANPDKFLPKLAALGYSYKAKDFATQEDDGHGHEGHGHEGHDH